MTEERRYTRRQLAIFAQRYAERFRLAQTLGQTAFEGAREYYRVLGYQEGEIDYDRYLLRYQRQDIASRVIDLPAQDSWKCPPAVTENGKDDTAFVQAWKELVSRLGIWSKLMRADKLSGIGTYGVLLLGFAGDGELKDEVKTQGGPQDLLYLRPFPQGMASIEKYEDDAKNPRYGLPSMYKIQLTKDTRALVHWQRVLHLAEGKTDNEVIGTPRLQKVFNRLDDLIKIVGGSSEATWLGMRPGTLIRPQEGYESDLTDAEIEEELEAYMHDPMRMMWLEGMEMQEIARPVVIDPTQPYEVILSLISTASGIPQRVLEGSAKGELAAAREDMKQWAGHIDSRQKTYLESEVLRPFIDRLIEVGVLPAPADGYTVGTEDEDGEYHWPSILEMDPLEDSEIVRNKAIAAKAVSDSMAQYPIGPGERRKLLGYPEELPPDLVAQAVRIIPEGSEKPVLPVPDEIVFTEADKQKAIALDEKLMPQDRGMLTAEVQGQQEYTSEY